MVAGNANYSALLTSTFERRLPKMVDNAFSKRPFQYWLRKKDRIKMYDGGESIVVPLMYGTNSTFKTYAGYDSLDLTPQEGITAAKFNWKQAAISVAISGIEEAKNSGEAAVFNLLDAKENQAEETIAEQFDSMFLTSDGTGNSGKDWDGLANLVGNASGTAVVGGIDCTDALNAWWRSYVETTSTALTLAILNTGYNTVSNGTNSNPDIELTTQALFEKYESLLTPNVRYEDTETANSGFTNLTHKQAVVMYDTYVPSQTWFILNSQYLYLVGHSQKWFKMRGFIQPEDKDAQYALILSYGDLVVSNRQKQGKLTQKT